MYFTVHYRNVGSPCIAAFTFFGAPCIALITISFTYTIRVIETTDSCAHRVCRSFARENRRLSITEWIDR